MNVLFAWNHFWNSIRRKETKTKTKSFNNIYCQTNEYYAQPIIHINMCVCWYFTYTTKPTTNPTMRSLCQLMCACSFCQIFISLLFGCLHCGCFMDALVVNMNYYWTHTRQQQNTEQIHSHTNSIFAVFSWHMDGMLLDARINIMIVYSSPQSDEWMRNVNRWHGSRIGFDWKIRISNIRVDRCACMYTPAVGMSMYAWAVRIGIGVAVACLLCRLSSFVFGCDFQVQVALNTVQCTARIWICWSLAPGIC